jgi:uroporphyrinogen-III synthase
MGSNVKPLEGLRVLVTRPQRQAAKWQQQLIELGAASQRATLLEVTPFTRAHPDHGAAVSAITERVQHLDRYQHLIFVSQNAVDYGCEWLQQVWPELPDSCHCYAVGSATASRLKEQGITASEAGVAMNSEALLALPRLQNLHNQRVLIFRGQGGRPLLAEVLSERGAQVDYCELYRRELPEATAPQLANSDWGKPGDVVALHSGESLQNWDTVINQLQQQPWRDLPVLVPGERVLQLAQSLNFNNIICAVNATDAEMARALIEWYQHQEQL